MDKNSFIIHPQNLFSVLSTRAKKKTNVADTSKEAYGILKKDGTIQRETQLILSLIEEHQPITSRRLSYLSKKERGNITRTLFNLVEAGKAKHPFTDKCPVTNKRVRFYTLIDWKGAEDGN